MLDWFKFNSLKANPDEFQFMVLGANKNKSFSINVRGINMPSKGGSNFSSRRLHVQS